MEIKLCFSVVCYIMLYLANDKDNLTQGELVAKYIACIDSKNSILNSCYNEKLQSEIKRGDFDDIKISKIMSGARYVSFESNLNMRIENISNSVNKFEKYISNCFTSNEKILLILLILDLINSQIKVNSSAEGLFYDIFKKNFKDFINQNSFCFSDMMIKILIYITSNAFKNQACKKYTEELHKEISTKGNNSYSTEDGNCIVKYIKKFESSVCMDDYYWDFETQTLTFINKTETKAEEQTLPVIRKSKLQANSDAAAPSQSTKTTSLIETSSTTEQPKTHNEDELNQLETSCSSSFTIEETHRMCQFCCSFKRDKHLPKEKGICTYEKEHKIVESNSICKVFRIKYSSVLLGK